MDTPKTVLVLCTGNSCRSQMAEALLNHDLAGRVRAISAGTRPQPRVAEGAIAALAAIGIPTAGLYPKDIDAVIAEPIDLVVTVCDNAKESCPVFPQPVKQIHLPFHDPHGEPLESFIRVRDEIRARLIPAVCAALDLTHASAQPTPPYHVANPITGYNAYEYSMRSRSQTNRRCFVRPL